ncbi:MAG TPA: hypothetical protein PK230_08150, partial [Chitinophagales bacterium]|nr:hypothetical protein [Chitinophagales bacterium]
MTISLEELCQCLVKDWYTGLLKCYELTWCEEGKIAFAKIYNEFINQPQGFDTADGVKRLCLLLNKEFGTSQKILLANDALCKDLLKEDFVQQKAIAH